MLLYICYKGDFQAVYRLKIENKDEIIGTFSGLPHILSWGIGRANNRCVNRMSSLPSFPPRPWSHFYRDQINVHWAPRPLALLIDFACNAKVPGAGCLVVSKIYEIRSFKVRDQRNEVIGTQKHLRRENLRHLYLGDI